MRLLGCGALVVITCLACSQAGPPQGQLAVIEPDCAPVASAKSPGYHGLAVSGDSLWWNAGYRAYKSDLSDPRNPATFQVSAWSDGNVCFLGDFTVVDETPVFVPFGTSVVVGDVQLFTTGANVRVHRLSATHVALAQGLGSSGHGALEFLDVSDPSQPEILALFAFGEFAAALAAEGGTVFATTRFSTGDGDGDILTVDASDPVSASIVSRAPIHVPWRNVHIAAQRDHDIALFAFTGTDLPTPYAGQIRWYRLSADFKTAELYGEMDAVMDAAHVPWGAAFAGDYLLAPVAGRQYETLVLRLDDEIGLVEHARIPFPGAYTPLLIRVDEERGLAFVSGSVIQILDLGVITDGVPRWP